MTFPNPFKFPFPSSSTSLSSDGKPFGSSVAPVSAPSIGTSQFLPPGVKPAPISPTHKPSSPTIELATTSTLNVAAAAQQTINNSIYCNRRRNEVLELNTVNQQLNLISTDNDSIITFAPSKFLYALRAWPEDSTPKRILCNALGNLVMVQGSKGNVTVLRLRNKAVCEEVEIDHSLDAIAGISWHPASPADHHLVILTKAGRLLIFDLLKAKSDFEGEGDFDDQCLLMRLSEIEQEIKLPAGRSDTFAGISFCAADDEDWLRFTALLVKESGDIFALCPLLPLQFRAQRRSHLLKLKSGEGTGKWLDEVLLSSEFVASATGDVDWVLCKTPPSFTDLQPKLQGPFLIQPEPMEIHHLASYDRVVDFAVWQNKGVTMAGVGFGSGKIDLLAVASEILPSFQLKNHFVKAVKEIDLPVMALIESINLNGSHDKTSTRRSVDSKIKIVSSTGDSILVSTDNSVIRIHLKTASFEDADGDDSACDWSIECDATVLVENLKNHVLCISNSKIYPGAVNLAEDYDALCTESNVYATSGLLDVITKFAFPLGKMEIEGGALQLESLIENLTSTLKRLKTHAKIPDSSKSLLQINEIVATDFNDQVSEWQESLVSPAMRVGHEIALRSTELVQILRRQREILLRAKTLLTAKPDAIEALLKDLRGAKEKNVELMERVKRVGKELSKHTVYDQLLTTKLLDLTATISNTLSTSSDFEIVSSDSQLVESQLLIQSEKLMKLKGQLGKMN